MQKQQKQNMFETSMLYRKLTQRIFLRFLLIQDFFKILICEPLNLNKNYFN